MLMFSSCLITDAFLFWMVSAGASGNSDADEWISSGTIKLGSSLAMPLQGAFGAKISSRDLEIFMFGRCSKQLTRPRDIVLENRYVDHARTQPVVLSKVPWLGDKLVWKGNLSSMIRSI